MMVGPLLASKLVAGALAIAASVIDARELRLPHIMTWPAAFAAISGQGLWGAGWWFALAGAGGGFLILKATQLLCLWRTKKNCLGSGDAFLMLPLGALLGPGLLPLGICASCALAGMVFCRRRPGAPGALPFGPFLTIGCLGVLLAAPLFG